MGTMWLRRLTGALFEVIEDQETKRGEPFEVADAIGKNLLRREEERAKHDAKHSVKHVPRFEKASPAVAKKAEAKAAKPTPAVATGPGRIPASSVVETPPTPPQHGSNVQGPEA